VNQPRVIQTNLFVAPSTKPQTKQLVRQYPPEPILEAYRQGRNQFGTTDLVLVIGDKGGVFNVGFSSRVETLAKLTAESPGNPMLKALTQPASELLKTRDAFWLWILRDDGTMCFCPVGVGTRERSAVAS
jgi:hypothetical protein